MQAGVGFEKRRTEINLEKSKGVGLFAFSVLLALPKP